MMQKLQAISGAALLSLLPLVTSAQAAGGATSNSTQGIQGAVDNISGIINSLLPLLITIAVVIFLWGLVKYLFKIGGEEGSKGGVQIMIWGIGVLFVMVSVWGLVQLFQKTLNVEGVKGSDVAKPENLQVTP